MRSPSVGTIYLLKRAELAVRSCMEVALAEFGLTPAQFLMLYRIRDTSDPSGADIAREARPGHRRILHTRLTPAGRVLVEDALRVAGRFEAEVLARVDREQILGLRDTLTQLLASAEQHELHPHSARARTVAPLTPATRQRGPLVKRPRPS